MDREGAERYLRILAEAELRQPAPDPARVIAIADALTDAAVLDEDTADQILDEFQLNLTLRRHGAR